MEPNTNRGSSEPRGITYIELLIVLVIVALLAGLVTPVVTNSIQRAKESTLKHNLQVTRQAIDDYYADRGRYPPDLESLVKDRYLRNLPFDPITERHDRWVLEFREGDSVEELGIVDLKSGSEEISNQGTPYREW